MLTDDELIADLSRLRELVAGIEYTGQVPMTRRSSAATLVPVAAVAAMATVGAAVMVGSGDDDARDGAGSSAEGSGARPTSTGVGTGGQEGTITLVSATITLGGRTIAYRHAPGEDPFGGGWQLAVDYGASLPAGATRFDLGDGEVAWVADAPNESTGNSVLIVVAGPHDSYIGAPSAFSRADLEEFVRTSLHGR